MMRRQGDNWNCEISIKESTHQQKNQRTLPGAAVAIPALHHRSLLRLYLQKPPPEYWLARTIMGPPPRFRQGRQGQSDR
eukprot:6202389-Pleurochrysis_carterae.AAC.1